MTISNAMLIRTAYGWDEAEDTVSEWDLGFGRREVLYSLGSYDSPADVADLAAARLAIIGYPRYQWDVEHVAQSLAELAYHGYESGDVLTVSDTQLVEMSQEQVTSLAVSMDSRSAEATIVATLRDDILWASSVESYLGAIARAAQKMIPGTGRGDWLEAQPVTPPLRPTPLGASLERSPCFVDHFPGDGPGVFDGGSGYGVTGADLIWSADISEGTYLGGITIVDGEIVASNSIYNNPGEGGGGGIVGPMLTGDMEATIIASGFSAFTALISPSTPTPGVDPDIVIEYLLKCRMIDVAAYYVRFSKQTGYTAEGRGTGWMVEAGANTATGSVLFLGPSYRVLIPDLVEGDVLSFRTVGQFPTVVTASVNGVAVFTVNTETDINYATDASPGTTEADLPYGAYGGFDMFTIAGDSAPPDITFYDGMVRADNFSLCPVV